MWQGNLSAAEQSIQPELKAGEQLLWSGKPQAGIRFRASDILLIPFSLLWGGFAIFWEASVMVTHAPFFFKLWGIPFVLVGLYLIVGRFFGDAKIREKTSFAVTSQRVIIVSEMFGRKVQSLNLRNLPSLTLNERSDGSGTITFGSVSPFNAWGNSSWPGSARAQAPSFEMIDHVRQVYDIIQEAQQRTP